MKLEFRIQFNWLFFLICINLFMFLLANAMAYLITNSNSNDLVGLVGLIGGYDFFKISIGQLWLLITSGFLHFDPIHFLVNMYSLHRLGQLVSRFYNDKILAAAYIFGSLGGSLMTLFVTRIEITAFQTITNAFSVGASSGIFALIGLLLGGTLKRSRYGFSLPFSSQDILPIALFSLMIGLLPGSNINNWAHVGGLMTGILLGLVIPHALSHKSKLSNLFQEVLYVLAILLAACSFIALIINFILVIFIN